MIYSITILGNTLASTCMIKPHTSQGKVFQWNQLHQVGWWLKEILITVSSVWEQKDVLTKGAGCSAVFLFSCKGVSEGTKKANMKSVTMWSFSPKLKLWGRSFRRWSVLQFSSLTRIMRAKCHFQHPSNVLFLKHLGTIADMTSINKMMSWVKLLHTWQVKKRGKKVCWLKPQRIFLEVLIWLKLEHYSW